jgi:glutaredoxin 3
MDTSIKIYSTPTCHFCHMAKDFLTEHNVAFTDYDVSTDLEKRTEMIDKSGQMGVPVIYVGDELIVGFDKDKLAKLAGIAV